MSMTGISIIIPLYKGEKYIPYWISIIKKNIQNLDGKATLETIFINDYPERGIENNFNDENILAINSPSNNGIHGSRVLGLQYARGDYITFLDQDDEISETFFISQLNSIEKKDVVVGNGYNEHDFSFVSDVIYSTEASHNDATSLDVMVNIRNTIVSPGQTMLRKQAIPEIWKKNILKNNGADDYFLWLLMLKQNSAFAINREKIFRHKATGKNVSSDHSVMAKSVREMSEYLKQAEIFPDEALRKICDRAEASIRPATLENIRSQWLYVQSHGKKIKDFLIDKGYERISIYGMGKLGGVLFTDLRLSGCKVLVGFDRNAHCFDADIPIVTPTPENLSKYVHMVDIVITTVLLQHEEVKQLLLTNGYVNVVSISEILTQLSYDF